MRSLPLASFRRACAVGAFLVSSGLCAAESTNSNYSVAFELRVLGTASALPPGHALPADLAPVLKPVEGGNPLKPQSAVVPSLHFVDVQGAADAPPLDLWPEWSDEMKAQAGGILGTGVLGGKPSPKAVEENLVRRLKAGELHVPESFGAKHEPPPAAPEAAFAALLQAQSANATSGVLTLFFFPGKPAQEYPDKTIKLGGQAYPALTDAAAVTDQIKQFLNRELKTGVIPRVLLVFQYDPRSVKIIVTKPSPSLAPVAPFNSAPPAGARRLLLFVGSNTLGEHAVPELASAYLATVKRAKNVIKDVRHHELIYVSGALPNGEKVYIEVHAPGSGTAFKSFAGEFPEHEIDLENGAKIRISVDVCDIGMSSRKIKAAEVDLLKQKTGDDLSLSGKFAGEGSEHIPALDGLAIIVHDTNPMRRISFTELRKIYSGEVTRWEQLEAWSILEANTRPPSRSILPLRRKEPSGTLDFFKEKIRPDETFLKSVRAFVSSGDLAAEVTRNSAAIGFVGQSYAFDSGVKRLEVYDDGTGAQPDAAVFPDTTAVKENRYPLSRPVYFYTRGQPANPEVKAFLDFAFTENAQGLVAEKGRLVNLAGSQYEKLTPLPVQKKGVEVIITTNPDLKPPNGKIILRLQGSNTIGSDCALRLAYLYFCQETGGRAREPGRITEKRVPLLKDGKPIITAEGEESVEIQIACDVDGNGKAQVITIRPSGSGDAFTGLRDGSCDLGMASRPIKPAEKSMLSRFGDLALPAAQVSIGLDALVPIVSQANPISSIELDQLRRCFAGEIGDWSDLGGTAGPIHLHCRAENLGTFRFFVDGVMRGGSVAPIAKRHISNLYVANAVVSDPGGLGFVPMSQTGGAKVLAVQQGAKGQEYIGNLDTVRLGQYPAVLRRHLYLYRPLVPPADLEGRNRWEAAGRFVQLAQSVQGQIVVASAGFVVETALDPAITNALSRIEKLSDQYQELMKLVQKYGESGPGGSVKAGTEICRLLFEFNKSDLTSESFNTINIKVSEFVRQHQELKGNPTTGFACLVAEGWADVVGPRAACERVAGERAAKAASYLRRQGINIESRGMGISYEPPNDSELNKQQNRRVVIKVERLPN